MINFLSGSRIYGLLCFDEFLQDDTDKIRILLRSLNFISTSHEI